MASRGSPKNVSDMMSTPRSDSTSASWRRNRPFSGLVKHHGDSVKVMHETELSELEKDPYEETRPAVPCFTRHVEFFQDSRGRKWTTEAATWQLGLRSQTPAFTAATSVGRSLAPPSSSSDFKPVPPRAITAPGSGQSTPRSRFRTNFYGLREHTFDMLRDDCDKKKPQDGKTAPVEPETPTISSARTPRMHADRHRALSHLDEPYQGKVGPNMEAYRTHLQARIHPTVCRHFLKLRPD